MTKYNFPVIDFTKDNAKALVAAGRTFSIRKVNGQKDEPLGDKLGWVAHWSACAEPLVFDDYHINICTSLDKSTPVIAKALKFNQKGQHLWGRNTGLIGISFSCLAVNKATYPTGKMVEAMALVIAEASAWFGINPEDLMSLPKKKAVGDSLVTVKGTLLMPAVTDHAAFAKSDGYTGHRIDIGTFLAPVRARSIALYKELKSNKRQFELVGILKD